MDKNLMDEETLKVRVAEEYFGKKKYETLGKIDFAIYEEIGGEKYYHLWAEAKRGNTQDIYDSFVQLILTIGKDRTFTKVSPPKYFAAFDAEKIAFVEYGEMREVFNQNDFDWTVRPSDHGTKEFGQLRKLLLDSIETNSTMFVYASDGDELKSFVKSNFVIGLTETNRILVDYNTFPDVFQKWHKGVFPTIEDFSDMDVMVGDFFLADLLEKSKATYTDKLRVVVKYEDGVAFYKVKDQYVKKRNKFSYNEINVGQREYFSFWNKYERPPLEKYINRIVTRRDLLVLPDIRERKGSFFTPQIWAKLSKEYIRQALGTDWQEKYYVWDCCAGTGNLLFDLTNEYNIFASTIDTSDVLIMKDCLNGIVPDEHIFQFDFLNDDLQGDKMPDDLKKILADPKKRKRLIIYINPPYAEAGNIRQITDEAKSPKTGVAVNMETYKHYLPEIGLAGRELFAQFFIRIYKEISGCVLAEFSKLKVLQAPNFDNFRAVFQPKLKSVFIVPANTFDNVSGQFPIGFLIWDTKIKEPFESISVDVYDRNGNMIGAKKISKYESKTLTDWVIEYRDKSEKIGWVSNRSNDFQGQNSVYIINDKDKGGSPRGSWITKTNVLYSSIFFAVKHCIKQCWLNDRDQFLYPNDGWKEDKEFQSNCLVYTLFHGQNRISIADGPNHWIPFEEKEVRARRLYDSHFMVDFMKGKIVGKNEDGELFGEEVMEMGVETGHTQSLQGEPVVFGEKAKAVMDAGKELWRYYHAQKDANPNASYYDIKRYFQGMDEKTGKMKGKSGDERYEELHNELKGAMRELGKEIEGKVWEYGFLLR